MMTKLNTLTERIQWLIDQKSISRRQFAIEVGIFPSNLSKKLSGIQTWTANDIRKISSKGVSAEWLKTGEGEPYDGAQEQVTENGQKAEIRSLNSTKPRLPMKVAAGMISEYYGGVLREHCEEMPVIHQFQGYDFTMIVKGDSMEPKYEGGDEIACKEVKSIIEWGKAYVVDTQDGAFLKRLYPDGDNRIKCVSYNSEYPDFSIDKLDINGIYRVVGVIRM